MITFIVNKLPYLKYPEEPRTLGIEMLSDGKRYAECRKMLLKHPCPYLSLGSISRRCDSSSLSGINISKSSKKVCYLRWK